MREALSLLGERDFRIFFAGYLTSLIGTGMVTVALTFAVLEEGRGASDVGFVLAAQTVPLVVLLLAGGVFADRFRRTTVMITADLVRCASQALLAALLITGSPPLWVFMALAGALGAGQAFSAPALTGLMVQVVRPDRLHEANALRSLATSAARVVGPALAGVIVAVAGAGAAIAVDAATYAVSAACLGRLAVATSKTPDGTSFAAQLVAGWREFRSRTWLWVIVVQFGFFNLLAYAPYLVLGPVLAREQNGDGGAAAWALVLSAEGVGAIVGGLVVLTVRPRRPLVVATFGTLAFAAPLVLLAVGAPFVVVAAGAFADGVGLAVFGALWETTLQREVPPSVLSRVSAYDWLGSIGLVPVGFALAGPLAATIGTRETLWLAVASLLTSCAAVLAVPGVRRLHRPA